MSRIPSSRMLRPAFVAALAAIAVGALAQDKGLSADKRGRIEHTITDFMYAPILSPEYPPLSC